MQSSARQPNSVNRPRIPSQSTSNPSSIPSSSSAPTLERLVVPGFLNPPPRRPKLNLSTPSSSVASTSTIPLNVTKKKRSSNVVDLTLSDSDSQELKIISGKPIEKSMLSVRAKEKRSVDGKDGKKRLKQVEEPEVESVTKSKSKRQSVVEEEKANVSLKRSKKQKRAPTLAELIKARRGGKAGSRAISFSTIGGTSLVTLRDVDTL